MSSNRGRNNRIFIAVGTVVAIVLFYLGFFVFQLAVAMRLEAVVPLTTQAMWLGFTMWGYNIYRRVKNAEEKGPEPTTNAEMLVGLVALVLFVTSAVGLMFPSAQLAACWANVVISFFMLALYATSGFGTIKAMINLFKLK